MTEVAQKLTHKLLSNLRLLAVWNNPIVWKNFKSRLRIQALFHLLLVLVVSAFMTLTILGGFERFDQDSVEAARAAIIPLGILQWLILTLSGTGSISSGIIHERVTGTIEYTRLTPMSPMSKLLGYLFGLPVREYIAFAITMPFMVFLLVRGQIPLSDTVPVYLVFFSSTLMYHLIGTVFGLVMKEWRMSVVFTIGLVIVINLVLPFFSFLGFPFLQYLTIRPVVVEKILPYLAEESAWRDSIPTGILSTQVDFFTWKISTTVFSLLLQGSLIFTLGLMVYRKWEDSFSHALSKMYSVFFFIALQVFCIGTLWPNLVFSELSTFGQGLLEDDGPSVGEFAIVIPMVYSFFTVACVFWLLYVITPTHDEYRSGLLRKHKLKQVGSDWRSYFDEYAGSLLPTILLTMFTVLFLMVVQTTMLNYGPLNEIELTGTDFFKLPLAAALIIFYYYVTMEYLEINKFAVLFLFVWIVPLLLAIFMAVAFEFESAVLYIASVSPIALLVISVQGLTGGSLRGDEFDILTNAYWVGCASIFALTCFFAFRLKQFKSRTQKAVG